MRDSVQHLVRNIHRDVLGLTVHDETHLDALWETADTLVDSDFTLSPAEAFVFGASVLLHDTALAVAAYTGGMAELRETIAWRDAEAALRRRGLDSSNPEGHNQVLFSVLRSLHAQQAERLIDFTFSRPDRHEAIPILADIALKDALGASIGRIAHSHHWNTNDLPDRLNRVLGAIPGYPPSWTVNEVKVACLLRCADAAHIDARRAPTLLYAISNIKGPSIEHWKFQNKLNQVARSGDKLVFNSGQTFKVPDVSSWWLAYETVQMIDREIKSSNAILEDVGSVTLSVKGVAGVESPRLFSRHLRVEGWTPVDAEVKVSDPVRLAKTLGGRNLYGSGYLSPLRELLQNSVDAVRARRIIQGRDSLWGNVRVIIEPDVAHSGRTWLHVDDNGIGMSERILTGPLIDFGRSFWSSSLLEEEFPGLRSQGGEPIGKFGIGFFSIFLLGDSVRVVSRRFDAGESSTKVLSFDELTRRPLVRDAITGELPIDFTTRVSVLLSSESYTEIQDGARTRRYSPRPVRVSFHDNLLQLVAALDVQVEIVDRSNGLTSRHNADWLGSDAETFLTEVLASSPQRIKEHWVEHHKRLVRPVQDEHGKTYGRAAFSIIDSRDIEGEILVSVGGFTYGLSPSYYVEDRPFSDFDKTRLATLRGAVGVVTGNTDDAARRRAYSMIPVEAVSRWATEQADLIDRSKFTDHQLVPICHRLLSMKARVSSTLPFGFLAGKFESLDVFKEAILRNDEIIFPLSFSEYKSTFSFLTISNLTTPFFTSRLLPTLAVVHNREGSDILDEETRRKIVRSGGLRLDEETVVTLLASFPMKLLRDAAAELWRAPPLFAIEPKPVSVAGLISEPSIRWMFRMVRPSVGRMDVTGAENHS